MIKLKLTTNFKIFWNFLNSWIVCRESRIMLYFLNVSRFGEYAYKFDYCSFFIVCSLYKLFRFVIYNDFFSMKAMNSFLRVYIAIIVIFLIILAAQDLYSMFFNIVSSLWFGSLLPKGSPSPSNTTGLGWKVLFALPNVLISEKACLFLSFLESLRWYCKWIGPKSAAPKLLLTQKFFPL